MKEIKTLKTHFPGMSGFTNICEFLPKNARVKKKAIPQSIFQSKKGFRSTSLEPAKQPKASSLVRMKVTQPLKYLVAPQRTTPTYTTKSKSASSGQSKGKCEACDALQEIYYSKNQQSH